MIAVARTQVSDPLHENAETSDRAPFPPTESGFHPAAGHVGLVSGYAHRLVARKSPQSLVTAGRRYAPCLAISSVA